MVTYDGSFKRVWGVQSSCILDFPGTVSEQVAKPLPVFIIELANLCLDISLCVCVLARLVRGLTSLASQIVEKRFDGNSAMLRILEYEHKLRDGFQTGIIVGIGRWYRPLSW